MGHSNYMQNKNNTFNIFKPTILTIVGIFMFLFAGVNELNAAARTASVSGNWDATSTWGGQAMPTSADVVTINSGITVTVNVASAACSTLTFAAVNASSLLTISGTNSLAVTGLISMPRPANTGGVVCTIAVGAGSLSAGSLTMSATTTSRNDIVSISTGTVTINGTTTTGTTGCQFNLTGAGTLDFKGAITSTPSLTTFTGSTVKYSFAGAQTIRPVTYSNLTLSGTGTKTLSAATIVTGNVTVNSGSTLAMSTFLLTLNGDLINSGGTISGTTGGVTIAGTATQNIAGFTTTGTVSMTKTAGVATLTGNVNGAGLTINGNGGTLNLGTALTHTFTGTWTRTVGTLNGGSSTINFSAGTVFSGTGGTFTPSTGTVNFSRAGTQTCPALVYNNLTVSGTNLKTFAAALTVSGVFSIEGTATISRTPTWSGTTYSLQYKTTNARTTGAEWPTPFTSTGGVIIAGTGVITLNAAKVFNASVPLTINSGSTLGLNTFALTLNGNLINNGGTTTGAGAVTITGTATQSIGAFTTTGLVSISKTSGVATFTGNVSGAGLTLSGGGTLNLGTGLSHTFSAVVTLTSGTLNGGSSTLTTAGNWTNNGATFTAGTSTIVLNGATRVIGGTASSIFNNLSINNASGASLGIAQTVNGTLTLTSGRLTLGTFNLTLGASASAVAGTLNATNMIVAIGTGELRKNVSADGSFLFPIGELTGTAEYSPVSVNFASGTYAGGAYVTAKVIDAIHPNNVSVSNYLSRYWTISSTGITSYSATVTGTYLPVDIVGTQSNQVAGKFLTSLPWLKYSTLSANTLTASGINGFGDFTGINNLPTIATSVATLTGFTYPLGYGPSGQQSFTVSGTDLTANILVTPPTNFEISTTSGTGFQSTPITVSATGGIVTATTIYVRMISGLALGAVVSANVASSSTGATTQNVACSGTVAAAPVVTTSVSTLSGFSYMFTAGPSAQQTFTVGGTNLVANVTVTPPTEWEISTTTGTGFVSTAITLTQTGGTLAATTIYTRLKAGLGVGSHGQNIVVTSTNAISKNLACSGTISAAPTIITSTSALAGFIYTFGAGPSNQQSFGITGTNLTANVIVTPPTNYAISTTSGSGFVTTPITLTQSGGNVTSTIYVRLVAGLAVATYGPANVALTSTGVVVKSISFSGKVVSTASILSSKSTLTGFGYLSSTGGPSSEQLFTVSGASLTANVIVTPPTNYEISTTSGSGFVSTAITLTQTGGIVGPSTIYVRLKSSLSAGNYTGVNITLASTGVTTQNVACVGIVFVSPLITAGGGGSICEGSTANLTSSGADILNRYWQGPNSFYSNLQNPTITNTTAAMSGTYTVTGNVTVGGNLITNGDFEAGNTSFGSSYAISTGAADGLWPESVYSVIANPNSEHTNFSACGDHTSGTGKQMVINGSPTAGAVIWTQSVPVIPGAYYEFTYWVQTVVALAPSQLQLYVNGISVGPVYTADLTTCTWKQFAYNTNAGSNTSLNLELINQNIIADGNDFALDDIVFQQILPATSSVDLTVNPIVPVSVTVVASANSVYSNTPVTFTATPTNGGSSPAYQWKVNGVAISGATNVTYTYQPLHGDVVLCQLTSSLTCVSNNPATANVVMTVIPRVNYWYGYIDTDWGDPNNWTADYVPLTGDDVEYATVANFGSSATNDLHLDMDRTIGSLINATTKRLVIPANKGLLVNNTISTDNNPDRIYIYSSTTLANGSLSYHNAVNNPVNASVEMYSIASWDLGQIQGSRFQWQYFGIPLRSVVAYPQFTDAYVRKWYETGTSISNHWIQLLNDSVVRPFYGYELCQQDPKTYLFKGTLENGNFSSGQLAVTSGALYPGQHVFANPYTAAIDIKQLVFGAQTESTIYMYHTGTYNAWTAGGETAPGTSPGYYIAVPKNLAGDLPGVPRQVPSMQAMLVKAMSVSSLATFSFTYNSVVMNNTDQQRARGKNTAVTSDKISTMIELKGANSEDKLWLLADPNCSRNFDNGWDGFKISGSSMTAQLFAMEKDGNYQVNAVDDFNDTNLGFQAGADSEYTLSFTHQNLETKYAGVYLVDLLENKTIDITQTGSAYSFTAKSTPTVEKRFKIVTRYYEKDAPDAETQIKVFSANGSVFVQNLGTQNGEIMLYNMSGRFVKRITFAGNAITAVANGLTPGAYIAKALTNNEEVSKRIIVR